MAPRSSIGYVSGPGVVTEAAPRDLEISSQAPALKLQALHIVHGAHGLARVQERFRRAGEERHGDDVELLVVELTPELEPAAVVDPVQHALAVPWSRRSRRTARWSCPCPSRSRSRYGQASATPLATAVRDSNPFASVPTGSTCTSTRPSVRNFTFSAKALAPSSISGPPPHSVCIFQLCSAAQPGKRAGPCQGRCRTQRREHAAHRSCHGVLSRDRCVLFCTPASDIRLRQKSDISLRPY